MRGRTDWSEHSQWMREEGAIDATWDRDGNLLSLTLGAKPNPDGPQQQASLQKPEDPVVIAERNRRIAKSASGRPVMRGESD